MPPIHVKSMPGTFVTMAPILIGSPVAASPEFRDRIGPGPGSWSRRPGVGDTSPVSAPSPPAVRPSPRPSPRRRGRLGRRRGRRCSRFLVTAAGRQGENPSREERDDRESPRLRPTDGCHRIPIPPPLSSSTERGRASQVAPRRPVALPSRQSGSRPCRLCPAVRGPRPCITLACSLCVQTYG